MYRFSGRRAILGTVCAAVCLSCIAATPTFGASVDVSAASASRYDRRVLADDPSAYWTMGNPSTGRETDLSGSRHNGRYGVNPGRATLPNREIAADFNGTTQYFEAADAAGLSPATKGVLTIEAWMRPDTLSFPTAGTNGYVHWMGKGKPGAHEYVSRMYSQPNTVDRGNRISGYLFNAAGGLGAGSYFQDRVVAGQWIHYVLVINATKKSAAFPNGYTKIYRDGVLRDQDNLFIDGRAVVPTRGTAPFRVGTRDFGSYFDGAIGKVAIYDSELSVSDITAHYRLMTGK